MNRVMIVTVVVSILIHLFVYWVFMADLSAFFSRTAQNKAQPTQTLAIRIEPPVKQHQDEPPPPRHTEDDITKTNQQDGTHNQAQKPRASQKQTQSKPKETPKKTLRSIEEVIAAAKQGQTLENIAQGADTSVTDAATNTANNLQTLSDDDLADNHVDSPLSKQQEEKARWYNAVLKRITEQVNYVWVKPDDSDPSAWGIIRLDIDHQGYLRSAWIHLPSGDAALDQSALRAIRSVVRYQIPSLSRYYRHLEFRYSGESS